MTDTQGIGASHPGAKIRGEDAMQIVDAQIHLWGAGLPSNLSHRQVTTLAPEDGGLRFAHPPYGRTISPGGAS